jgi:hypothetical protein
VDEPGGGWGRAAFPPCRRCGRGDLVPLSDFGNHGAAVRSKAWVCTHPGCGFALKIRNGEVVRGEPVADGSAGGGRPGAGSGGPRPPRLVAVPGTDGVGRRVALRGRAADQSKAAAPGAAAFGERR